MRWPFPPITRSDVIGGVIIGAVIAALAVVYVVLAAPPWPVKTNWGFGPDWDCVSNGKGEPVCIKKPPTVPSAHSSN
jgi:hypothetical protein